jgi:hypothetical protein
MRRRPGTFQFEIDRVAVRTEQFAHTGGMARVVINHENLSARHLIPSPFDTGA